MRYRIDYSQRGLKLTVANLHSLMASRWLEPNIPSYDEEIDAMCAAAWEIGTVLKRSPHLCLDRYCECHWLLSQWEPETLPGL